MARIRSCHPGQWTDEAFVSCSAMARLLAIGLRNEADDNGIFEWNPTKLKMRILPADNCDAAALLDEIALSGQVMRYTVNGREYGIIRSFTRFQKPKKPTFQYPPPSEPIPKEYALSPSYSPTSSQPVPHQSGNRVSEGSGSGSEGRSTPPGKSAASRVPTPPTPEQSPRCAALTALAEGGKVRIDPKARMHLRQWADEGITDQQMADALAIARDKKPHPNERIPIGFLVAIMADVLTGTKPPERRSVAEIARDTSRAMLERDAQQLGERWWEVPEKVQEKGREEGVSIIPGQPFEDYVARVVTASGNGPWMAQLPDPLRERVEHFRAVGVNP